jgi:hypothetical protein
MEATELLSGPQSQFRRFHCPGSRLTQAGTVNYTVRATRNRDYQHLNLPSLSRGYRFQIVYK